MMNIKGFVVITGLVLITGCGQSLYTRRELRHQIVPKELQNKTWTLTKIYKAHTFHEPEILAFNNSDGTDNCRFTIKFAAMGKFIVTFKEYEYTGVYVIDKDRFRLIYSGFREKVVWTTNPECGITPTQLGLYVNWGAFDYTIEGRQLTLTNRSRDKTGATLVLTSSI